MRVNKNVLRPAAMAEFENTMAQEARNRANIDYIAMMTDVEIPTDEEEAKDDESEV